MGRKLDWRARDGIAGAVFGIFVMAIILLLGMGLLTYNQIAATRQTVTATVTAAVRAAVPASFQTETLAKHTSTSASGLQLSASQFAAGLASTLPDFWPGAKVAPCTTTPHGSPAACVAGQSFLVTLPPATAAGLDLAGPMVVTNLQLLTKPGTVTHYGVGTKVTGPAVAADVAVPIRVQIGGLLNTTVWEETGVTQLLYADQGGATAAGSRFLPYVPATPTATLCTQWAGASAPASVYWNPSVLSTTVPCSTPPTWCPTGSLACRLVSGSGSTGIYLRSVSVEYVTASSRTYYGYTVPSTAVFPQADWPGITWQTPPAGSCWQGQEWSGSNLVQAEWATPGALGPCTSVPANIPAWAQWFWYTSSNTWCYAGMVANASSGYSEGWSGGGDDFVLCTPTTPY